MNFPIKGLHHITATVDDAQADLDFYTKLLGLRLVKKTVNFDNPGVYHFYYGNEMGTPGTIMTTFPYKGQGVRVGKKGNGQVVHATFSVPRGSISEWEIRLREKGIKFIEFKRFGDTGLRFEDPSSLGIELLEAKDGRKAWLGGALNHEAMAIRGIHSVSMQVKEAQPSISFMTSYLNFSLVAQEENRFRLASDGGGAGKMVDLIEEADAERGLNGIGTVHHVALAIGTEKEQRDLHEFLVDRGIKVTEIKDRKYFRSIYFREPGGILFEVATLPPGFAVDEERELLGQKLKLPEWEEPRRREIESTLPEIFY